MTDAESELRDLGRLMRLPEVLRETGLSKASVYRKMKAGAFPRPAELGEQAVGWYEAEVKAWISSRPRCGVPQGESSSASAQNAH